QAEPVFASVQAAAPNKQSKMLAPNSDEPLSLQLTEKDGLRPGRNVVLVESLNNRLPYVIRWSCRTPQPPDGKDVGVRLETRLSHGKAREGETVKLAATVENKSGKGQGMAIAVLGLPAGLALPDDFQQLKDLARLRDGGKTPGTI